MIVVTGATGTTGSELVNRLKEKGEPFRAVTRNPDAAATLEKRGVEVALADLGDARQLESAMQGATKLFLLSSPDERQVELQSNAIAAAQTAGITYALKVSVIGVGPDSPLKLGRDHAAIEAAATESGIPFTFLRPHSFMQNLLGSAATIAGQGEFFSSTGDGQMAIIDARDIAAVAAELLTTPMANAPSYELTGPEALSFSEVAETLTEVLGKSVRYVDVTGEQLKQGMLAAGLPEWLIDDLITLHEIFRAGYGTAVSDAVARITGRPATSFRQFATEYARAFT